MAKRSNTDPKDVFYLKSHIYLRSEYSFFDSEIGAPGQQKRSLLLGTTNVLKLRDEELLEDNEGIIQKITNILLCSQYIAHKEITIIKYSEIQEIDEEFRVCS